MFGIKQQVITHHSWSRNGGFASVLAAFCHNNNQQYNYEKI